MISINSSLYIPPTANIIDLSCEVMEDNNEVVKNVQYQKINGVESIVDNISRRVIFQLTDNPNVTKLDGEDLGLCFRVRFNNPGSEMSTVYRIDSDSNAVYKTSSLFLTYLYEGKTYNKYILAADQESYINILTYLQQARKESIKDLVVKVGGTWQGFINVHIPDLIQSPVEK